MAHNPNFLHAPTQTDAEAHPLCRNRLFHLEADYDSFVRLLREVRQAMPLRVLAW